MGKSDRVDGRERIQWQDFSGQATASGFSEGDARRVWRRVVEKARSASYDKHTALAEFVTRRQLKDVADGPKSQFRAMTDGDWRLIQNVAAELTKGL